MVGSGWARLRAVLAGGLASLVVFGAAPLSGQAPAQLVSTMAANEVGARNQDSLYRYNADEVSARTGGHRWTEKVVETTDGPLHRLLAIDGKPLDPAQSKAEADRIAEIVRHPDEFRRLGGAHKNDEVHAQQLLELLPRAFVITPAGEADGCAQFAFHANPKFQPSSYEERVAAAMSGTVSLRQPMNRLCTLKARIDHPVEFGFGFLGRIDAGGNFSLDRRPVDASHWKSDRISVHMQGRILLMKSLTREQDVVRTEIQLLPPRVSLEQAAEMITR